VFEIWNEAWDKMSAEDLATISGWIAEVILRERPDAIIGPNLTGSTSKYDYDAKFIAAGGMAGMRMVCLHPYADAEDRQWLREYQAWLRQQLGRDIAIYVTEYGSHSTPEGPSRRSELEQARRVVRQSLGLYAEGVRALIPHVMGQREENPAYHEDWFGFFRLNHEPKPVLLAHATCARMIDGSRYLGDLWYGPGIGAMLFDNEGLLTLALWTRGDRRDVGIDVGTNVVSVVNLVGTVEERPVRNGRLDLTLSPEVVYLQGVSPSLARLATRDLNPDRWPAPEKPKRLERTAHRFAERPVMDGHLGEWSAMTQVAMVNPKVNGDDASGTAYLAWDDEFLYLALDMRDNEVLNTQPRGKLYREDSMEVFVSTEPRDHDPGYGPFDCQFFVTPDSGGDGPVVGRVADREAGHVVDVEGATKHIAKTKAGWLAEVGLPWRAFPGFSPTPGAVLALELRVNDADSSHPRWKIDPSDIELVHTEDPTAWSTLTLRP
jgi:hypothetical protein